jgi:hypothetical protein
LSGTSVQTDSVLLPAASFALLGAGTEGADLLSEFGWSSATFAADFVGMLDALSRSSDPEAEAKAEISRRIAHAAQAATGRVSVTSLAGSMVPSYVFRCGRQALVARLHGPVVEWLLVGLDEGATAVRLAVERAAGGALVSATQGGETLAAVRLEASEASLAAHSEDVLARLRPAATSGFEGLVAALLEEIA